jgi:flavin reductase (DIM6/NTAB) family NADH-FMN oxidoreductase RutF
VTTTPTVDASHDTAQETPPEAAPETQDSGPGAGLDPGTLRWAYGAFPSGVVAVAAQARGRVTGLAASSFTSVSLDPPLVSISVASTSNTWPVLREAAHLGVSVLADHHDVVCRQLAGPADQRFAGLPFRSTVDGAVLLDEAVVTFDCSIHAEIEAGDHLIVVLALHRVADGGGSSPLVFHRSGFKRLSAEDLDQTKLDGRINGKDVDAA